MLSTSKPKPVEKVGSCNSQLKQWKPKKKSKLLSQFGAEILEFKVGRVLFLSLVGFCVTFWSFLSKILYLDAYLTLQAESRENVDVFKKKEQAFISIWS